MIQYAPPPFSFLASTVSTLLRSPPHSYDKCLSATIKVSAFIAVLSIPVSHNAAVRDLVQYCLYTVVLREHPCLVKTLAITTAIVYELL